MAQTEKKPRRRWLKPLLFVSLAVNLIVLGLVIGAVFGDHQRPQRGTKAPHGVRTYISAMTNEQREAFLDKTHGSLAGSLKTLKKLRGGHKDVMAAITATPFSEDTLRSSLDKQRSDVSAIMGEFQEELIATLSAMTDEERAQYIERMKEMRKKRWHKKR